MNSQVYVFIVFIFNGFLIGLLFDFFRIIRKSFKTKDVITYIEDIVFWILSALLILYSIFKFNNGMLRLYIFTGIAIGILLYIILFSKIFINSSLYIIKIIKRIINYIIIIPCKYLKRIIIKPTKFLVINLQNMLSKYKINLNKFVKKLKHKKDFS